MKYAFIGVLLAFALSLTTGCGWPINPNRMPEVMQQLKDDQASGCFWMGGRAGMGSLTIMPVPMVPAAGMGSGEILLGRVNSPNTKLSIQNGNCTIERGPSIPQLNKEAPE